MLLCCVWTEHEPPAASYNKETHHTIGGALFKCVPHVRGDKMSETRTGDEKSPRVGGAGSIWPLLLLSFLLRRKPVVMLNFRNRSRRTQKGSRSQGNKGLSPSPATKTPQGIQLCQQYKGTQHFSLGLVCFDFSVDIWGSPML